MSVFRTLRGAMTRAKPVVYTDTDWKVLGRSTKHAYYNGAVLPELVKKYGDLIDMVTEATRKGELTTSKINQWLIARKRIGAPSVNGIAILAGLPAAEWTDLLVVKTIPLDLIRQAEEAEQVARDLGEEPDPTRYTRDPVLEMTREIFVTRVLTNLRAVIPNFVMVLGAFSCSALPMRLTDTPQFCANEDGTPVAPYALLEKVVTFPQQQKTLSFASLIDRMHAAEDAAPAELAMLKLKHELLLVEMLMQTFAALAVAQRVYKLTHWDLHDENVLFRARSEIGNPPAIEYPYGARAQRLRFGYENRDPETDFFPVIIDFGWSYVEFPDRKTRQTRSSFFTQFKSIQYASTFHDVFKLSAAVITRYARRKEANLGLFEPFWRWLEAHRYCPPGKQKDWAHLAGRDKEQCLPVFNPKHKNHPEELAVPDLYQGPEFLYYYNGRDPLPNVGQPRHTMFDGQNGRVLTPELAIDKLQEIVRTGTPHTRGLPNVSVVSSNEAPWRAEDLPDLSGMLQ